MRSSHEQTHSQIKNNPSLHKHRDEMKNRIVFIALSINTKAKIMKVFSAGGGGVGGEGRKEKTNKQTTGTG